MGSSLKLLSVRGIDIRLHITFPLILLWAGLQFGLSAGNLSSAFFGVVAVSILFLLVTLHELGHSFAAQYYGVPVKQIVLTPLGGVAQLSRMPENPIQELVIALAGPAVNMVIAILMGALVLVAGINIANPLSVIGGVTGFTLTALFSYIFVYNIFLALFNLLPAFPMDGGRVLRALLALPMDYVRATKIAGNIGRVVAIMMGLYGLFNGGFFLMLIAVFIFTAGAQEMQWVERRGALRGYTVENVYSPSVYRLDPRSNLQQAANLMLFSSQRSFPVLDGEKLIGLVPQSSLMQALKSFGPYQSVATAINKEIEPVSLTDDLSTVAQRLNEEQVDALPVVANGRFMGLITQRQIEDLIRMQAVAPNAIPQSQSV